MDNNNMQDQDVTVLVDQNTGAPVYPNSQSNMGQSMNQTGYTSPQPGMGQQAYGQPMNQAGYQNMQPNMGQPMGQQPYGQQMNQGYYQNNYNGTNNNMTPGMKINPKILGIVVGVILVIILCVVFIPKLFKGKGDPDTNPFDGLEIGMERELVIEKFDIDDDGDDYQYADVEAFGVTGNLQIVFYDDELSRCNWYVDDYQCDSEKQFEQAAEDIEEHYTDLYGKPDKEEDGDELECVWVDDENDVEYELEVDDNEIVLRMDEVW